MHYLCMNKVHLELQRAITLIELAPSPSYSNTNVHLVNINVLAKFVEFPSLPVQDIKEKPKCCGQIITKGNNSNRIYYIITVHLVDINVFAKFDEIPSLPVQII